MKDLIVDKKYNEKKLNKFLLEQFPSLNSNTFYKALRKKDILVNGSRVNDNVLLHTNDSIRIYITDEHLYPKKDISYEVIYEDDHILLINKPSGIEVISENTSLTTFLQEKYGPNVFPCHRIDRNTFGLVLFAKSQEALSILLDKFKNQEIEKHYLAQVYGIPTKKQDTLLAYLFKDHKKSQVFISDIPKKGYQKIITSYQVIQIDDQNSSTILDINLKTRSYSSNPCSSCLYWLPYYWRWKIWKQRN